MFLKHRIFARRRRRLVCPLLLYGGMAVAKRSIHIAIGMPLEDPAAHKLPGGDTPHILPTCCLNKHIKRPVITLLIGL